MIELWKRITIHEKEYSVSNFGNITSNGRPITTRLDKDGYLCFTAGKKGHRTMVKVHRVVAELFVSNPDNKPEVNHIDYDRANARFDNLEWCTRIENVRHSMRNQPPISGDSNPNSKLTQKKAESIRELYNKGKTIMELAKEYSVGWTTISHIVKGETWT